jgi:hypothetical protein
MPGASRASRRRRSRAAAGSRSAPGRATATRSPSGAKGRRSRPCGCTTAARCRRYARGAAIDRRDAVDPTA